MRSKKTSYYQAQGEDKLLHGDLSGVHFFKEAIALEPNNPELFYKQGLSLLEFGDEEVVDKYLKEACRCFKQATTLDPSHFHAYMAWGQALYLLGIRKNDAQILTSAKNKLKKALSFEKGQSADVLSDLYVDYGNTWAKLGELSGEAIDLNLALKAFEKALQFQEDQASAFWKKYGEIALLLGQKMNDQRFFYQAINCYKNAISMTISSYEGWFDLGKALILLYSYSHDEDHFTRANECFSTAANFAPHVGEIYLAWARLLSDSGHKVEDHKRLAAAIDKCQKAARLLPGNHAIYAVWAEALAGLGVFTDRLDLIHEGQNQLASLGENHILFHAEGTCLHALGSYFNDLDYYYQAIESFQAGLSLNRTDDTLWFALGKSYLAVASLEDDLKSYEKAARFFARALNLKLSSIYHYKLGKALAKCADLSRDIETIENSVHHFEQAIQIQKNAIYLYPEWMFNYAVALDLFADFTDSEEHYAKAIDILGHVLMVDPEYPHIHYQLAIVIGHAADLMQDSTLFARAIHHYRLAEQREKDADYIILDWALTLINWAESIGIDSEERENAYREAEFKLIQAAKLGNIHAYYQLACLYSLTFALDKASHFLQKAHAFDALPPVAELLDDEWLENLRNTDFFQTFIVNVDER